MSGLSAIATELRTSLIDDIKRKRGRQLQPLFLHEAKVTTNGDDAASHSGGRGTNRSDGRDRRDGPTRAHAHARL
jgi:hypothetical protein